MSVNARVWPSTEHPVCVMCALIADARVRRASNWVGGDHDAYIAAVIELDRLITAHECLRQSA